MTKNVSPVASLKYGTVGKWHNPRRTVVAAAALVLLLRLAREPGSAPRGRFAAPARRRLRRGATRARRAVAGQTAAEVARRILAATGLNALTSEEIRDSSARYFIWLLTTLVVGWLYIGLLTNPNAYDTMGWVFALAFPALVGATLAVLVANHREQKACPLNTTGSGLGGSILGIFRVGCSTCPAILLGWLGVGAAVPGAFLASLWLKLASLLLLVAALFWAGKKNRSAP